VGGESQPFFKVKYIFELLIRKSVTTRPMKTCLKGCCKVVQGAGVVTVAMFIVVNLVIKVIMDDMAKMVSWFCGFVLIVIFIIM
jgi:hypothetical protein